MVQTVLWLGIVLSLAIVFAAPMITVVNDLNVPLIPTDRDRCPVCGMLVNSYPEWVAQIRHSDGETVFFDGCKDLFKYLLTGDHGNVAAVFVTNYYDGEVIAARTAFFVIGSNVMGPMGAEFVPHRSIGAAEDFKADHDGRRILRFDEIDEATLHEMK